MECLIRGFVVVAILDSRQGDVCRGGGISGGHVALFISSLGPLLTI